MDVIVANMEILKADTFRKAGASKSDIKMIADLYAQGKTVEQISVTVNVQEAIVRAFCPVLADAPVEMEIATPPASAAPVAVDDVDDEIRPSRLFKKDKHKSKR